MNLEELRTKWMETEARLAAVEAVNAQILAAPKISAAKSALRRLVWGFATQATINLAALVWLGQFMSVHRSDMKFLLPALVLHLGFILATSTDIRHLVAILSADFSAPVLHIQAQLVQVRRQRIQATKWALLMAPIIWAPMLIVGMQGFLGVDAYKTLGSTYLVANLLVGVLLSVGLWWLARQVSSRLAKQGRLQGLLRDIGGHNLRVAEDFLAEVNEFGQANSTSSP